MPIGRIEIGGQVGRQIDRMIGRLPALDKALKKRLPGVADEIGRKVVDKAKAWAPVRSGRLLQHIRHEVRDEATAVVGIWDLPYAYVIDFGINSPMLVPKHSRTQTQAFGEPMTPKKVDVRTFVRRTKFKGRDFMHRAYYNSFPAMFGILNRAMEEAKAEADLAD
jgi:hypothetical protein